MMYDVLALLCALLSLYIFAEMVAMMIMACMHTETEGTPLIRLFNRMYDFVDEWIKHIKGYV